MRNARTQTKEGGLQEILRVQKEHLTAPQRARVKIILTACRSLISARPKFKLLPLLAASISQQLSSLPLPEGRPVSAKTLERLFYRWEKHAYKWQVLLDRRSAPAKRQNSPRREFSYYLASLLRKHRYNMRSAVSALYASWSAGESIPGYMGENKMQNTPYPKGWSYENLCRRMKKACDKHH